MIICVGVNWRAIELEFTLAGFIPADPLCLLSLLLPASFVCFTHDPRLLAAAQFLLLLLAVV